MKQIALPMAMPPAADRDYLADDLLTYIGSKRARLPFILAELRAVKARLGKAQLACLDLFAGSGAVSRLLKSQSSRLVSNDFEDYAAAVNRCYLTNRSDFDPAAYGAARQALMDSIRRDWRRGIIAEHYAPADDSAIQPGERAFFTRRNAEFIDTARQHISSLPPALQMFFLAPLLVRASIHSNTAGVFKGFYKNRQGIGAFGGEGGHALKRIKGEIEIPAPIFSAFECDVRVTKCDATRFPAEIGGSYDLVYLDPPYNQHPYGSNYFMLNLILHYRLPPKVSRVSGIPTDWQRSPFNKPQQAARAFFKLLDELDAKFFLISYNSEGFLKKEQFLPELAKRGSLSFSEAPYHTYRASRNLAARPQYVKEYLFLLEKSRQRAYFNAG